MTREQKIQEVAVLKELLSGSSYFYITDSSQLTVEQVNRLRRKCHDHGVRMRVAKNTLLRKALEDRKDDIADLLSALKGPTALMLSQTASAPAKVIKDFRKESDKPVLKAAFIESAVYIGDHHLEALASLKSKPELIGDVIALLQSPVKNLVLALKSSGGKLAGIMKTLSERKEQQS